MWTKLSKVHMKETQEPQILFNQLAAIECEHNDAAWQIDQDDLIAVALEKVPEPHKSILTSEQ